LVIGSMLGGVAAAWYSIAYNTVTRIRALPLAFIRALFPRIAADATGSRHELNRTARVLTLMLVPIVTIAIPAVEPLFRLWIGDTASAASAPIARIMLVGLFVNCIAHVPVVALQAGGAPERVAKLHVWELPVFLAIMWVAIHQFGVLGAAYAWAGRLIVDAALLFRTADLGNLFRRDVLIGGMAPVASFLVVLLLPDRPIMTVFLAISVVAGWLIIDDQAARRSGTELTLAGLASELRRWRAIRARSSADA
jgi:O-antigen/teichoic acid export membrane protein